MHAQQSQPDDHARGKEHLMKAMAEQMKREPEKFKLRKTLAEHPFRNDQAESGLHPLPAQGAGERWGRNGA